MAAGANSKHDFIKVQSLFPGHNDTVHKSRLFPIWAGRAVEVMKQEKGSRVDKFLGQSRPIRNMSPLPPAFFTVKGRKSQT